MSSIDSLQDRLGYRFQKKALLMTALTHPSYAADHHTKSYQRMEFLGDAVLELAVSRYLYLHAPELDEGRLSRQRAALVCEEALSEIARAYGLGKYVLLGSGEDRGGGRDKPSILADVFEAVLAAVYLDGGTDASYQLVEAAYGDMFKKGDGAFDPKTRLQELMQKQRAEAPVYETIERSGPDHDPVFTVAALSDGRELGRGEGRTKQTAQQEAAKAALIKLSKQ